MIKPKYFYLSVLLILLLAIVLLSGCNTSSSNDKSGSEEPKVEVVTLRVSHPLPTNEIIHLQLEEMAKRVKERSNGTLIIEIFPNAELGNQKDNLEQILRGVNIITLTDPAQMGEYVPDYAIMFSPYKSPDEIAKLVKSSWHEEMVAEASNKGLKVLAMDWYWGQRHLISNKVITTPADLVGLKVRTPAVPMWIETINAMGGSATVLQWSEVYTALSQGVVDAAESPLSALYASKLYEVRNNISLTGHFTAISGLVMSQQLFDSLTDEQKIIIQEETRLTGQAVSNKVREQEGEFMQKLKDEGIVFNEVDRDAFVEATEIVHSKFPEWSDGLYDRIKSIIN